MGEGVLVVIELHPAVRQNYSVSTTSPSVFLMCLPPCMLFCLSLWTTATVAIPLLFAPQPMFGSLQMSHNNKTHIKSFLLSVKMCRLVYALARTHTHRNLLIGLQLFPLSFPGFTSDRWAEVCVSRVELCVIGGLVKDRGMEG